MRFHRSARILYTWAGICLALFQLAESLQAQDATRPDSSRATDRRFQIEGNVLYNIPTDSGEVKRLIGRARLIHRTTIIQSDTAESNGSKAWFRGRVRIIDGTDTLTARRVVYTRASRRGEATGSVRLSDGDAVLHAPSGVYLAAEKVAHFSEGVELRDSVSVLTSRTGSYWTEDKIARFSDDVSLIQDETVIRADSVEHHRLTDWTRAVGRVVISRIELPEDPTSDPRIRETRLAGARAEADRETGESRIDGDAVLLMVTRDSLESDTLAISARRLVSVRTDSLDRLVAVDSVRIWRKDLSAVADSAVFVRLHPAMDSLDASARDSTGGPEDRGRMSLFGGPWAWFRDSQVTGDTLVVLTRDDVADSLFVVGQAFVASQDSVSERIQQIQGRNMQGDFEGDSLRTLAVGPNAEVIYYRTDATTRELKDAVQLSADRMTFHFENGEVARAVAHSGIQGSYYDPESIPDSFRLSGYKWQPTLRPGRELVRRVAERVHGGEIGADGPEKPAASDGTP